MDYTDFAVGPRGETICSNASGELFYITDRGTYAPVRREEDVRLGLLGNIDIVTKDEFYDAGNLSIGGYIVDPADCKPISSVAPDVSNDNYLYTPKNGTGSSLNAESKMDSTTTNATDSVSKRENGALNNRISNLKSDSSTSEADTETNSTISNENATLSKREDTAHTKRPYQVNNTSLNRVNNTPLGSAQGISGLAMGLSNDLAGAIVADDVNSNINNAPIGSAQGTSGLSMELSSRLANEYAFNQLNESSGNSSGADTETNSTTLNETVTLSKGEDVTHTKRPYQVNNTPLGSAQGISGLAMGLSSHLANEYAFNHLNESASSEDVGAYVTDNFSSALQTNPETSPSNDVNQNLTSYPSNVEAVSSGGGWDFTADSEQQDILSSQLNTAADKFDNKVSMMYREIGNLSSSWVGEDYDAYCNATNGYKTALGDLSDSIRMYGKHFEKMADTTEELSSELIEIIETCTHRHAG